MSSLDALHQALEALDPDGILKGKSYEQTWNESLGFTGPADFHVGLPYNPWPSDKSGTPREFESALAVGLKDVLKRGLDASSATEGNLFIDIAQLSTGGWAGFFDSVGEGKENLALSLGRMVGSLPPNVTPIIRFLLGLQNEKSACKKWEEDLQPEFANVFWPDGKCVFPHPKAQIHVGLYSPSFDATRAPDAVMESADSICSLVDIVRDMVINIRDSLYLMLPPTLRIQVDDAISGLTKDVVIGQLSYAVLPSVCWNHAKILAVDGQTLMTGGAIFYPFYSDDQAWISDLQAKLKGDATISAHAYCDHIWQYLNSEHMTDAHSFRRHAPASPDGGPKWDDSDKAPLFDRKPTSNTGKAVLTVSKLGNWRGPKGTIEYPIQALDAMRDLILNLAWHLVRIHAGGFLWIFKPMILATVSDQKLLPSFRNAGVTPTAWASRIVRCKAIEAAQNNVYIDTDTIACCLHQDNEGWIEWRQTINEIIGLEGQDAWDGVLWPYELMAAIASFMESITDGEDKGAYILLTTPLLDGREYKGWEDPIAADELKQRIRWLAHRPFGEGDSDYDKWFHARCTIKRISSDASWSNHCKVVCVDNKLLYVGSDNVYPNYNGEHGIWIDDQETIDSWYTTYWTPRWKVSPTADMARNGGSLTDSPTLSSPEVFAALAAQAN